MKICTQCTCSSNLRVDLGLFARDEKLPFVEHILGLLIKDRFGSYRRAQNLPPNGHVRDVVPTELDLNHPPIPASRRSFSDALRDLVLPPARNLAKRLFDLAAHRLECKHPCLPAVENRLRSAAFNSS